MTYQTAREQATLGRLRRLSHLLDNSIRLPLINYRIGLDPLIGLVPGVGDAAGLLLSGYLIFEAVKLGTSRRTLFVMTFNAVLDAGIGSIPILGDIFGAVWKANARNMYLLEQKLEPSAALRPPSQRALIALIATSLLVLIGGLVMLVYTTIWLA